MDDDSSVYPDGVLAVIEADLAAAVKAAKGD
jgi:hypothetical protein